MSIEKRDQLIKNINALNEQIYIFNKELDKEVEKIQNMCLHEKYIAGDNGDYHRSGYDYTCERCKYCTSIYPATSLITYK
jgi:hypothetical protein